MTPVRHNKIRNLGLCYEMLAREVAEASLADDTARAAAALSILERHLGRDAFLSEELAVHRNVIGARGCVPSVARAIVDQLKAAGIRLAAREGARQAAKSALIREMHRVFGRDAFDRKIPDYKAHATVGMLLARGVGSLSEGVEFARLEEALVSFLSSEPSAAPVYDRDANALAYRTAVEMYSEEFGRQLDDEQGKLLSEYVRLSLGGHRGPFERCFARQRASLLSELKFVRSDDVFRKDADMASKLDEAISALSSLSSDDHDAAVETLMGYHKLRSEIGDKS